MPFLSPNQQRQSTEGKLELFDKSYSKQKKAFGFWSTVQLWCVCLCACAYTSSDSGVLSGHGHQMTQQCLGPQQAQSDVGRTCPLLQCS